MTNSVLFQIAAVKSAETPELRALWVKLYDCEAPARNRLYLESCLIYRIQELAFGGLNPKTVSRLENLGDQLDGGNITLRRIRTDDKPLAGTKLIREWKGTEYSVTVLVDGYEWQGRPYQSLSAIARAITGTRWNGWTFFGLRKRSASK